MYPANHFWWGGWWWMFPMVVPFLFFLFSRWWSRTRWSNNFPRRDSETAMDILKKRYAKGEITKEEFDRMKKDLTD